MGAQVWLDRPTALAVDLGDPFVVHGFVTTSIDGSSFDAVSQWDGLSPHAWRAGGLFDLTAGGLRLVEQHPERHEYVLASTGGASPACAALGIESPCLVPRTATLAHERLRTARELEASLSGSVVVDAGFRPAVAAAGESSGSLALLAIGIAVALAGVLAVRWARRRARTAVGRVRRAAHAAIRATRGDVTLKPLVTHIRAMLLRAVELDRARRACSRKLARIDLVALERKRDAYVHSSTPESGEALLWIDAECQEAAHLKTDHETSIAGLERIESALRCMVLRLREHRGTRARALGADPVDAAAAEVRYREEARSDVERALHS